VNLFRSSKMVELEGISPLQLGNIYTSSSKGHLLCNSLSFVIMALSAQAATVEIKVHTYGETEKLGDERRRNRGES
jgi:hypothetical protein